jgi:hypothetical protein
MQLFFRSQSIASSIAPRIQIRALALAVAAAALCCAAVRGDAGSSFTIVVIVACISALTYKSYRAAIDRATANGVEFSSSRRATLAIIHTGIASTVILLADLAFFTGYYGFLKLAVSIHLMELWLMELWSPYIDSGYMIIGAIIGAILALLVASSSRRTIWPAGEGTTGWRGYCVRSWPVLLVAVVGAILMMDVLQERWRYCVKMADFHAQQAPSVTDPRDVAFHDRLREWYMRASVCPWQPLHPPPILAGGRHRVVD